METRLKNIEELVMRLKRELRSWLLKRKVRLRREGRRLASILLCGALVAGNLSAVSMPVLAGSNSDHDYTYEMERETLRDALITAVSEGTDFEKDLDFAGEYAEDYLQLLEADGTLYELDPEFTDEDPARDRDMKLQIFVRIKGSIPVDEAYEIDGDEEIIFLLSNKIEENVTATIRVDGRETEAITVLPADSIVVEAEGTTITDGVVDEIVSPVSGIPGAGFGSGSGGSSSGTVSEQKETEASADDSDEEVEIVITNDEDDEEEDEITAENSEVTILDEETNDQESTDAESIDTENTDTEHADSAENNEEAVESGTDDADGDVTDDESTEAQSEDAGNNEEADDTKEQGNQDGSEISDSSETSNDDSAGEDGEENSSDTGSESSDSTSSDDSGNDADDSDDTGSESSDSASSDDAENDADGSGNTGSAGSDSTSFDDAGNDKKESGSAGGAGSDNMSSDNAGKKDSSSDTSGNSSNTSDSSSDTSNSSSDTSGTSEVTASISIHHVDLVAAGKATSSNADTDDTASSSNASPSDAEKRLLDGIYYDSVRFGKRGAAAFATTAAELGLDADADGARTISYEGDGYRVDVSYGEDAGLPRDVEVSAVEYASDTEEFQDYYAQTAELYGWEEDRTESVRLFDITLLSDGTEVEPSEAVQVVLTYLDEEEALGDYTITHFAENGTETLEVTSEYADGEQTMSFDMESFSYITVTQNTTAFDVFWLWMWTSDGEKINSNTIAMKNEVLKYTANSETYYLIPCSYFSEYLADYGYSFDEKGYCPLFYLPKGKNYSNYCYAQYATEHACYASVNSTWYVRVQDDSVYDATREDKGTRRANIFYLPASVVLNLGNGNGTNVDEDYSGDTSKDKLRYTIDLSSSTIDDDNGTITLNLPCDDDLGTKFAVTDKKTETLGKDLAYDYKLVGWFNIATGEYYNVENGSCTATIDLHNRNVFYADWIANSYDYGSSGDTNLLTTVQDTSDFIKIHMFDYNELFNLNSASLVQTRLDREVWTDSGYLADTPQLANTVDVTDLPRSFAFRNVSTNGKNLLGQLNDLKSWNIYTGSGDSDLGNGGYCYTVIVSSLNDSLLKKLFDTSAGNTIDDLGVYYVGEGNYLFSVDENGYYTYDSANNAAVYNQSDERFYVYDGEQWVSGTTYACFLPYNSYKSYTSSADSEYSVTDGSVNYWFGMDMQVDFYLPNDTGTNGGNQINGKDMMFQFSGDDDVWVFVDDELVMDLGGIHDAVDGTINFSTGQVTAPTNSSTKETTTMNTISAGAHTLRVYYLERGAAASNLKLTINLVPRWKLESATAGTMSVTKEWKDENGNTVDSSDTSTYPAVTMGLFEKTDVTVSSTATSATYDTTTYTLTDGYSYDDDGYVNAYVSGGYLYVRVDTQELSYSNDGNEDNDWTYTWELLDEDKTYEVLELTALPNYKVTSDYTALQSYEYWHAVDEDDLNGTELDANNHTTGGILEEDDLKILLTDGAQYGTANTSGFPTTYSGYVISGQKSNSTKEMPFSQKAEDDDGDGVYTYGVISDTDIESTSVLTVELSGNYSSGTESGMYIPEFYIKNSLGNYLYVTYVDGEYKLTWNGVNKTEFCYNSLGELYTSEYGGLKVTIDKEGNITVSQGQETTNVENVKIYVYGEMATVGKSYTITNTKLPTVTLKKVDSTDGEKTLDGAVFTLQNASGDYYSYDSVNDKVVWSSSSEPDDSNKLTTENGGIINFNILPDGTYTLTEVTAPDGYNKLSSPITLVIADGVISSAVYGDGSESGVVSVDTNDTNLVITIENTPGADLPETGGPGTLPFRTAGLLLAGSSAYLIYATLRRRRRWQGG
ncbi:MAG: fibro-slime domain-containing protein [Clostridiales bacterium]|nr:fibro-slime domain-containing protein [Clostridiales bacterium]